MWRFSMHFPVQSYFESRRQQPLVNSWSLLGNLVVSFVSKGYKEIFCDQISEKEIKKKTK